MRIGLLTGGGDAPGLNAVIRAVVRQGVNAYSDEFVGFRWGWKGMVEDISVPLTLENTSGILHRGGTILGSSRTNVRKVENGFEKVREVFETHGLDALIPIGGDDTLGVADELTDGGLPCVGVPKTIDNDLSGTDFTFGFQTAVQIATDAIDRLHTTAESHNRVMVVEVMGRHAGWIAAWSGMAGGADAILVPEKPFDVDEVCTHLVRRHDGGKTFSIVVVAEGAVPQEGQMATVGGETDSFGHARLGGIAQWLESEIGRRTGYEARQVVLGHVQRGGTPLAFDRVLGTRFGVAAIDAVHRGDFGTMVALHGQEIEQVPLKVAVSTNRTLDPKFFETAEVFFG